MKTSTFLKIATHDHTGGGRGAQLGAGSIINHSISGAKIRLLNDEYLRGRNAADSADINIVKVNISDKLEIGADIAVARLINNVFIQARNNADSAYVNLIKLNASDKVEISPTIVSATAETVTSSLLKFKDSVTLVDDTTSATDASIVTLTSGQSATVEYQIIRDTDVQKGRLELVYPSTISESYTGVDAGITFSLDAGVLKYTSTSTGDDATMKYLVIKE